jgi:DNA-binding transcriptional ArsR family regulator
VALFDAFASVAQALGSGRRAEIVDLLAQGERSVEEIANEISQSVANTSQHLHVLARAGLVRSRREGTRIFYRLASERVGDLWAAVRDVAVRLWGFKTCVPPANPDVLRRELSFDTPQGWRRGGGQADKSGSLAVRI